MTYQTGQPVEIMVGIERDDLYIQTVDGRESRLNQIGDLSLEAEQLTAGGHGPCYEVEIAAYDDHGYEQAGQGGTMLWAPNAPGYKAGICWGADSTWYDASSPDDAVRQSQEA